MRNTADRLLLTTTNYDLLFYGDRLVAVKGLSLGAGLASAATDPREGSSAEWLESKNTERVRAATAAEGSTTPAESSGDRFVVRFDEISRATLTKRFGVVKLRLELSDGRKLVWRWMNSSLATRYDDAAPALRQLLGSVLR